MSNTAKQANVHAQIQSEATAARAASAASLRDSGETPALAALLDGASEAIGKALPQQFEYLGRTYWLRCTLGLVQVAVYDNPTTPRPLVAAIIGSGEEHGHAPGH
jgi:hypothetical protein